MLGFADKSVKTTITVVFHMFRKLSRDMEAVKKKIPQLNFQR